MTKIMTRHIPVHKKKEEELGVGEFRKKNILQEC